MNNRNHIDTVHFLRNTLIKCLKTLSSFILVGKNMYTIVTHWYFKRIVFFVLHLTQGVCSERRSTYNFIIIFREKSINSSDIYTYFGDGNKTYL